MKFFLPFVATVAALAVAAPAASNDAANGAVVERGTVTIQQFMSALNTQVKKYTDDMNKIVAALPANPTKKQKKAAAAAVIKDIKGLTSIIHTANIKVAAAEEANVKRAILPTLGDLSGDILGQLGGQAIALADLLLPIIEEINSAIEAVLATLPLAEVLMALQPLLTELPTLISGLGDLVDGLIAALVPLLTAAGGILSGILGQVLSGIGL